MKTRTIQAIQDDLITINNVYINPAMTFGERFVELDKLEAELKQAKNQLGKAQYDQSSPTEPQN